MTHPKNPPQRSGRDSKLSTQQPMEFERNKECPSSREWADISFSHTAKRGASSKPTIGLKLKLRFLALLGNCSATFSTKKDEERSLLRIRFWLVVVAGGTASTFGILANALLTRLFLTRPAFRHSSFFFLGFVALFDTLLDSVYILLLLIFFDKTTYFLHEPENNLVQSQLRTTAAQVMPKKKRSAKRRVDFVSQPEIYEITPLTDKPDFESPVNGVLPSSNGLDHDKDSLELIVEDSADSSSLLAMSMTKVPPKKGTDSVSRRAKVFRGAIPKLNLCENNGIEQSCQNLKANEKTSLEDNSLLSPYELGAFKNGSFMKAKAASQLWSSLFCPQDKEDIFSKVAYSKLNAWLVRWLERLKKKQQLEGECQQKGKKRRTDEEEDDEDACFDSSDEHLDNPAILAGPTGCGKTAMVYCAAKSYGFQVLEIPPYERRDRHFLEQKLSGASATYNMNVGANMQDIRNMFNPKRDSPANQKRKMSVGFTLILIDECELQYSSDYNFWSTLKQFCANSLVPIVLTCNDYEIVRRSMLNREPTLDTFCTIHFNESPTFQSFNAYLRQWLIGFTGKLRKNLYLRGLFEQKCGDFRAILNALQFDSHYTPSNVKPSTIGREQLSLKEFVCRAERTSTVDAMCGKSNAILWRANQMADLDYKREGLTGVWTTRVEQMDEIRSELLSLLNCDGISRVVKPSNAVSCAALQRSYPDRIYASCETSLDYLPCLLMIDKFALQSRVSRRQLHPFETVDPESGGKIDESHKLKYLLDAYKQLQLVRLYLSWLHHFKWLYLLGQIFKLSSVLCLIIASFERYMITSHWTFSGFEERTRWLLLSVVLFVSVGIRFSTSVDVVILFNEQSLVPFRRYSPAQITHREWLPNFFNLLTVIVPFGTLVFFNGGIVLMLRRQNVQQLRLMIVQLTMGYDFMKVRRRNIRSATNTLLLIISIYLISNLLSLFLSVFAFLNPGFLQKNYPQQYRIGSDCSSLLTVVGNALRFPAHFISNGEVREHFKLMCCPPKRKVLSVLGSECEAAKCVGTFGLRRESERLENPWFSALLTTRQSTRRTGGFVRSAGMGGRKSIILGGRRTQNRHCTAAYVKEEAGRQQQGFCAVCNGPIEEECCSGGALGTARDSMDEELFTGGEETGEDEERMMEEGRPNGRGVEENRESLPLLDLVELRFDPAEFSSIQQSVHSNRCLWKCSEYLSGTQLRALSLLIIVQQMTGEKESVEGLFFVDDCFGMSIGRPLHELVDESGVGRNSREELVSFDEFVRGGGGRRKEGDKVKRFDLRPIDDDEDGLNNDGFFDIVLGGASSVPEDPISPMGKMVADRMPRGKGGRSELYKVQRNISADSDNKGKWGNLEHREKEWGAMFANSATTKLRHSFCPTVGDGGGWLSGGRTRSGSQDSAAYGYEPPEEPCPASSDMSKTDDLHKKGGGGKVLSHGSSSRRSVKGAERQKDGGTNVAEELHSQSQMMLSNSLSDLVLSKFLCCFRALNPTQMGRERKCGGGEAETTAEQNEQQHKYYSWDKRDDLCSNSADFRLANLSDETRVKEPGQLNGQPFQIEGCEDSLILLLDRTASITVDDSRNCVILAGPCQGSIFLRDCTNILVLAVCQQFRTRDCRQLIAHLFCATSPTIEETDVTICPLLLNYSGLQTQMHAAGLSPFVNRWSQVHNFTPETGKCQLAHHNAAPTAAFHNITLIQRLNDFLAHSSLLFMDGINGKEGDENKQEKALLLLQPVEGSNPGLRFYAESVEFANGLLSRENVRLVAMHDIDLRVGEWDALLPQHKQNKRQNKHTTDKVITLEVEGPAAVKQAAALVRSLPKTSSISAQLVEGEQMEQYTKQLYRLCVIRQNMCAVMTVEHTSRVILVMLIYFVSGHGG
uniref:C-CAP/cofactor C-like domain-containing protein n=1 Tax=Globodera rostochiensis TaxID=31243 RepID=A0A914I9E5_GLORO